MANDQYPSRETSTMVALFQRAHAKVTALQRMDDQIATMVAQHERLQAEVRAVQKEIHEEFERTLRFNSAPSKIVASNIEPMDAPPEESNEDVMLPTPNGDHSAEPEAIAMRPEI